MHWVVAMGMVRTSLEKDEQNEADYHEVVRFDDFAAYIVEEGAV